MCEYCEKERVLKSSNFCGAAKMQIIGEFLEVQGDSHKIKWFNRIYQPSFMNIPFGDLRSTIKNLCERYEIQYIEQEESYTSKSSFLDNDVLPEYNPEQPYKGKFSGKRIYRGLYQSANGTKINADVNGAANILRKANRFDSSILCQGFLANPQRIRLA